MAFVLAILWIVLAFVFASAAKNKGRSYAGYLILGLFLSPILSGFILLVLGEKK